MSDQVISCLQTIIAKRTNDGKACRVSNLVGSVSQIKQLKDWLKNKYKLNNSFDIILLQFIQENNEAFNYDPTTGQISNNNSSTQLLIKPNLLYELELNHSIDSFDDNLFVIEIIIFVLETIMESEDSFISIKRLIQLIDENIEKQFDYYKNLIKSTNEKTVDKFNSNESVLVNLLNELKTFFDFDSERQILTINVGTNSAQILKVLTNSLFALVKNLLITHFYRFGRKSLESLDHLLENEYSIVFKFMNENNISLIEIIDCFKGEFVIIEDKSANIGCKLIDLNPLIMDNNRCLEFQLMYKYGCEIEGLTGDVIEVRERYAIIQSSVDLLNEPENHILRFKVKPDFVKIFSEQVTYLSVFLHSGDQVSFDVTFMPAMDQIFEHELKSMKDLWTVTRIHKVKHSANCFVTSTYDFDFDDNYEKGSDEESDETSITDSSETLSTSEDYSLDLIFDNQD